MHTCVSVVHCQDAVSHTHKHTPSGTLKKNIALLILGNLLHTRANELTLNVHICVFGVLPVLAVKLNFHKSPTPPTHVRGGGRNGQANKARGEGVILWIHDRLFTRAPSPAHPSSSSRKRININTYCCKPFPSSRANPPPHKKITTLGYQLIKPSRRPLPCQKKKKKRGKDNKAKVLRPNQRREINTVPQDLHVPLSAPTII